MKPDGEWFLSPAYDVMYAHNPAGQWTNQHQMSAIGKRDHVNREDLVMIAESISLKNPEAIIDEVASAVEQWPEFAKNAGVKSIDISDIKANHRLL